MDSLMLSMSDAPSVTRVLVFLELFLITSLVGAFIMGAVFMTIIYSVFKKRWLELVTMSVMFTFVFFVTVQVAVFANGVGTFWHPFYIIWLTLFLYGYLRGVDYADIEYYHIVRRVTDFFRWCSDKTKQQLPSR